MKVKIQISYKFYGQSIARSYKMNILLNVILLAFYVIKFSYGQLNLPVAVLTTTPNVPNALINAGFSAEANGNF